MRRMHRNSAVGPLNFSLRSSPGLPCRDYDPEAWNQVIQVNLIAPLQLT